MRCVTAREALSAVMDGEPPGLTIERVDTHLQQCPACRRWERAARDVTRRVRVGNDTPSADQARSIVEAIAADVSRRRSRRIWSVAAALVAVSGALQLAVSVPLLILAHHRASGHSRGWVVGLELLVGAAFLLGALVMLWHTKGSPQEPAVPLAVADESGAGRRRTVKDVA